MTDINIAGQEYSKSTEIPAKPSTDVVAVGYIMVELMQKYPKENGVIGIENVDRWPSDSEAVKFLSMIEANVPVHTLLQVSPQIPSKGMI